MMAINQEKLILPLKILSVLLFTAIFSLTIIMLMGCKNAAGDLYPPTVGSTYPENGASGIPVNITATATFDSVINPDSITTDNIALKLGDTAIEASLSVSADGKTITLDPTADLDFGAEYTLNIGTGIADEAGNALIEECNASFSTAVEPNELLALLNKIPELDTSFQGDNENRGSTVITGGAPTTVGDPFDETVWLLNENVNFKMINFTIDLLKAEAETTGAEENKAFTIGKTYTTNPFKDEGMDVDIYYHKCKFVYSGNDMKNAHFYTSIQGIQNSPVEATVKMRIIINMYDQNTDGLPPSRIDFIYDFDGGAILVRSFPRTGDVSMWTGDSCWEFTVQDEINRYADFFGYSNQDSKDAYIIILKRDSGIYFYRDNTAWGPDYAAVEEIYFDENLQKVTPFPASPPADYTTAKTDWLTSEASTYNAEYDSAALNALVPAWTSEEFVDMQIDSTPMGGSAYY